MQFQFQFHGWMGLKKSKELKLGCEELLCRGHTLSTAGDALYKHAQCKMPPLEYFLDEDL
jgi:hypothetical protein